MAGHTQIPDSAILKCTVPPSQITPLPPPPSPTPRWVLKKTMDSGRRAEAPARPSATVCSLPQCVQVFSPQHCLQNHHFATVWSVQRSLALFPATLPAIHPYNAPCNPSRDSVLSPTTLRQTRFGKEHNAQGAGRWSSSPRLAASPSPLSACWPRAGRPQGLLMALLSHSIHSQPAHL